jgi:hypothetical protein
VPLLSAFVGALGALIMAFVRYGAARYQQQCGLERWFTVPYGAVRLSCGTWSLCRAVVVRIQLCTRRILHPPLCVEHISTAFFVPGCSSALPKGPFFTGPVRVCDTRAWSIRPVALTPLKGIWFPSARLKSLGQLRSVIEKFKGLGFGASQRLKARGG